jgi:methyl-accepting chemotaxis protein
MDERTPGERRLRVGLLWKVAGSGLLVALAVCLTLLALVSWQYERHLTEESVRRAQAIGDRVALKVAEGTAEGPPMELLVRSAREVGLMAYVWVEGPDGRVLGHTFGGGALPEGLHAQASRREAGVRAGVRVEALAGAYPALDVAVPIEGGRRGAAHVGVDMRPTARAVSRLQWLMVPAGLLAGLVGVLLGGAFLSVTVVRPLRAVTAAAGRIVRTGDLTAHVEARTADEVGELAGSFNAMVARLRGVLGSMEEASGEVVRMTAELQRSAEEQRETVSLQAAKLQQTQVTAREIQQTARLAAQRADVVLEVAARAEGLGRDGEAAVQRSVAQLAEVRSQVEAVSGHVRGLGERTRQIASITQAVKDLADQSNMLALNAAIEAVRSGEHGKGFGVVAREIRTLADQSIHSTDRVREILDDVSGGIAGAVELSAKGAALMEGGVAQVRASGESLQALGGIVRDNLGAARQIAAAVGQQNAGLEQVFSGLEALAGTMDATLARIDATSDAARSLQALSERLAQVARSYRTGGGAG